MIQHRFCLPIKACIQVSYIKYQPEPWSQYTCSENELWYSCELLCVKHCLITIQEHIPTIVYCVSSVNLLSFLSIARCNGGSGLVFIMTKNFSSSCLQLCLTHTHRHRHTASWGKLIQTWESDCLSVKTILRHRLLDYDHKRGSLNGNAKSG